MLKIRNKIPPDVAAFLHLGWTTAVLLTGSSFLGIYIDKKFQSSPFAVLICSFLAILSVGYLFYSSISRLPKSRQKGKTLDKQIFDKNKKGF